MKPGFVRFGYKRMGEKTHYNYLDFLTGELIPFLQTEFGIRLNRENMGIIGASMGAIAALNAILEYPELFGFAGCVLQMQLMPVPCASMSPILLGSRPASDQARRNARS